MDPANTARKFWLHWEWDGEQSQAALLPEAHMALLRPAVTALQVGFLFSSFSFLFTTTVIQIVADLQTTTVNSELLRAN